MTNTKVSCPNCGNEIDVNNILLHKVEEELKQKYNTQLLAEKKKIDDQAIKFAAEKLDFEKKKQNENELFQERITAKLKEEKARIETEVSAKLEKEIANNFENKLAILQKNDIENSAKLKVAQQKELEYLAKENQLKNKEAELDLEVQRKLSIERQVISLDLKKLEDQRVQQIKDEFALKIAEKEKQLEDQKKLADQMKQKADQGSMQLQGEVQELLLEEMLKSTFPFDNILEVGKGVKGADCIQTIRNKLGNQVGTIIYESKRTKDFSNEWIDKLKADMRIKGADIAVIVTQALPKEIDRFGEKDGVYICTFSEVRSVAALLRNALMKIYEIKKNEENKGDKMILLYDYLVGNEFGEQWKAISEGFRSMKESIQRERDAMERLWKAREKQLEKVLLNATHIRGSIEGIAGAENINLSLLEDDNELKLID
jgi:hypothetical protein